VLVALPVCCVVKLLFCRVMCCSLSARWLSLVTFLLSVHRTRLKLISQQPVSPVNLSSFLLWSVAEAIFRVRQLSAVPSFQSLLDQHRQQFYLPSLLSMVTCKCRIVQVIVVLSSGFTFGKSTRRDPYVCQ